MKTKREICEEQIALQEELQCLGYNIIQCCNCGTVLIHRTEQETIDCFCGETLDLSDCEDLFYDGMENNAEFNED